MPPKKKAGGAKGGGVSGKADQKKKQKTIEVSFDGGDCGEMRGPCDGDPVPCSAAHRSLDGPHHDPVQDKTFGMKNKKGKKQQAFIQQVQQGMNKGGKADRQVGKVVLCSPRIAVRRPDGLLNG